MKDKFKKEDLTTIKEKDSNEIFFEKFSNTKKDFKKNKIKKSKFYQFLNFKKIDIHLEDNSFIKWSYIIFISFLIINITFSGLVIAFFNGYFLKGNNPSEVHSFLGDYNNIINLRVSSGFGSLLDANFIFACLSISLLLIPYLYLISTWFIGFNNTYRSKIFYIFNLSMIILTFTFLLLMIIFTSVLLSPDHIGLPPFKVIYS